MPSPYKEGDLRLSTIYVRNLLKVVEQHGYRSDAFRERSAITHETLSDRDANLSFHDYSVLIRDILENIDIPAVGLEAGDQIQLQDLGLFGYAIFSCRSLKKAYEIYRNYGPLHGQMMYGTLTVEGDRACFTLEGSIVSQWDNLLQFEIEQELTMWLNLAHAWPQKITRHWFSEVQFSFARPAHAQLLSEHFQCPIRYGQISNGFYFDIEYLELPFERYDEHMFTLTEAECAKLLHEGPITSGFSGRIRTLLARCSGRFPSIDQVCEQFNMSRATLRRKLVKEETSYKQLLSEFRLGLACRYLNDTQLSINEIAYLTGYSDPANFSRAFKSHFDLSPIDYRSNI